MADPTTTLFCLLTAADSRWSTALGDSLASEPYLSYLAECVAADRLLPVPDARTEDTLAPSPLDDDLRERQGSR